MSQPSSQPAQKHPRSCGRCASRSAWNCCRQVRPLQPSGLLSSAPPATPKERSPMAEVVIVPDAAAAGAIVADEIVALITANPAAVLGLATGSTPLPVYEALRPRLSGIDVSQVRGFALDEYVGIDPSHPESYRSVITREVVEPLGLDPQRIHVPNGALATIQHAGDDYEVAIDAAGGVDLQILGIGTDGHIGFNEPGSS